ncbi:hypothetical protein AB0F68_34565 [Micromonospora sp. NPDC023966]|uniref:hypothetical protein n=1 Tax=Micromonospora sp. NPDC023966 TaxID=3154699 RepID=UPI0033F2230D
MHDAAVAENSDLNGYDQANVWWYAPPAPPPHPIIIPLGLPLGVCRSTAGKPVVRVTLLAARLAATY